MFFIILIIIFVGVLLIATWYSESRKDQEKERASQEIKAELKARASDIISLYQKMRANEEWQSFYNYCRPIIEKELPNITYITFSQYQPRSLTIYLKKIAATNPWEPDQTRTPIRIEIDSYFKNGVNGLASSPFLYWLIQDIPELVYRDRDGKETKNLLDVLQYSYRDDETPRHSLIYPKS